MYVTSSTGFHCCLPPSCHSVTHCSTLPSPLILYSNLFLFLSAALNCVSRFHSVLHTLRLYVSASILTNCCYVARLTYLFVILACRAVSTSLCLSLCCSPFSLRDPLEGHFKRSLLVHSCRKFADVT